MPTTTLRPSASSTNTPALAKLSIQTVCSAEAAERRQGHDERQQRRSRATCPTMIVSERWRRRKSRTVWKAAAGASAVLATGRAWRSRPLTQLLAEQAGRSEHEHDDQDREHHRLRPARIAQLRA